MLKRRRHLEEDAERFSYAFGIEGRWKRKIVQLIERLSGQPKLKRLYEHNRQAPEPGESFWQAAVRLLEIGIDYDATKLMNIPADRPLVVVSNHPFGVLDGLVICRLVEHVREDFRLLVNAVLVRAPEIEQYFLPVDFAENREALKTNLDTRKKAMSHLCENGCVIIFPAGGISTAPKVLGRAVDDDWKPFTAKMILESKALVLPVFFEGQNSRLFQLVSHFSASMRLALIFREISRRMGKVVQVQIGELIDPSANPQLHNRQALMDYLRQETYSLERRLSLRRRFAKRLKRS